MPAVIAAEPTVFVIDDDDGVRDSVRALLEADGLDVAAFPSCEAFLGAHGDAGSGCVVLDLRMPGMGGLELLRRLGERGSRLEVIVVTGHGDVRVAVEAMKAGAVDFIEKPFRSQVILDSVHRVMAEIRAGLPEPPHAAARSRLDRLTAREREVLAKMMDGLSTRAIAAQLGISARTVEVHRARVMTKTGVRSLPQLVRLTLAARPGRGVAASAPPAG